MSLAHDDDIAQAQVGQELPCSSLHSDQRLTVVEPKTGDRADGRPTVRGHFNCSTDQPNGLRGCLDRQHRLDIGIDGSGLLKRSELGHLGQELLVVQWFEWILEVELCSQNFKEVILS